MVQPHASFYSIIRIEEKMTENKALIQYILLSKASLISSFLHKPNRGLLHRQPLMIILDEAEHKKKSTSNEALEILKSLALKSPHVFVVRGTSYSAKK
jgi:hypothetical protein